MRRLDDARARSGRCGASRLSLPRTPARPPAARSPSPCLSVCVSVRLTITSNHRAIGCHFLVQFVLGTQRSEDQSPCLTVRPLYARKAPRQPRPGCGRMHTLVIIIQLHYIHNYKPGRGMKSVRDTRSGFMYWMMCIYYCGIRYQSVFYKEV